MKHWKRALLIGALGVLLLLAGAALALWFGLASLDEPMNVNGALRFKVPPGARFARVADDLGRKGVVKDPRTWAWYARFKGLASAIKAGEYEIEPGMTPRALLDKLVSGQVVLHSLTIIDGWRIKDLLSALRHNPDVLATLPADDRDIMQRMGLPGVSPEGQFLPETYRFPSGTTDLELLRQAHAALSRVLAAAWAGREPALPLKTPYDLLIMASIVEKESGLPEELPKIAGLYLHRLRIGMRLQADPTVIFGLGDAYDGELHTVDLRTDGPYNTYTRVGLPPTPIALAGAAVIQATARPLATDALYFVASERGDGSHVFSTTLEEHNAAVARYVARQRQRSTAETAR
jgi:UPF0755 protein